ncbi:MAG: radical SAM protein [Planctomycetota bacterium]
MDTKTPLTPDDHSSTKGQRCYVYPVVSRRAEGLSIGVNLSPEKECNWACSYCEVEGLVRATPEEIEVSVLRDELDALLQQAKEGCIEVPPEFQRGETDPSHWIRDICFSGDGEPTLSPSFEDAVTAAIDLRERHGLASTCNLVVITNGSRVERAAVRDALKKIAGAGGEIWFKVDTGSASTRWELNGVSGGLDRVPFDLAAISQVVPTWVQTMAVHPHADPGGVGQVINEALERGAQLKGIHLYGLRRPSHQPGGETLRALSREQLEMAARALRMATGLEVRVAH